MPTLDEPNGELSGAIRRIDDLTAQIAVLRRRVEQLEESIDDHIGTDNVSFDLTYPHPGQYPTSGGDTSTAPDGTTATLVGAWGAFSYGTGLYSGVQI